MKTITLATALLLMLAAPAEAQFGKLITDAYEVRLSALRLPQGKAGSIAFKKCDECDYTTRLTTPATRWVINHQPVTLEEFKAGLVRVEDRNNAYVTVVHHLESDRVTEVAIVIYD